MLQRSWLLLLMGLCAFAGSASGQTIEWADNSGQPISQAYEFSSLRLRATDAGSAGLGALSVRVTSDLRGDEEWVNLWEDTNNPGVFISSSYAIYVPGTLATDPPAQDGWLEVTENPGPPLQRDTIRAFFESCSTPPCPTDAVPMIGSTIRLTDSERVDVDHAVPGSPLYIAVRDHGAPYWAPTTATIVSQSGDSETVSLPSDFSDPYIPINVFRQSIDVELGPAVPGDGVLQVQDPDTITASHPDPLGLSSSTDTAVAATAEIEFLDRAGTAVDALMVGGDIRVRAFYLGGNVNPAEADTVTIDVRSRQSTGSVRDTEMLQLFETGPNTAVFTGTMPSRAHYFTVVGDGVLQVWRTNNQNDTVEAELGATTATATLIPGFIRIVDASGADVTDIPESGTVYLRVEYEDGNDPMYQGYLQVRVLSVTTGDEQYVAMWETGPDTAVFTGSLPTVIAASPVPLNGQLETQSGETIRASLDHYFGSAVDLAVIEFVNDPPAAMDDTAYIAEDSAVMIDVLANDNDVDGDSLSITAVTQGSNGAVTFNASSVTYTPNANFNGANSFTYSISDGNGGTATATVSITVNAINDNPVAANDSKTTAEDTATTIGVLANDSDIDGDTLSITAVTQGSNGTVTFNAGSVTYTPNANFNGSDSFSYTISDGNGGSATATVTVSVTAVNDNPVAANDSAGTSEDTAVAINVLINDSDPEGHTLSITAVTQGTKGSVTFTASSVTYTPAANANGPDSFTYTVSDGNGGTAIATVAITINAVNDSPTAANDSKTTAEDTATTISVLTNDSDVDGDSLSITAVTQGSHGAVTFNASSVTYTPNANFNGSDSFTYSISDGNGGTATATVSITVNAVNDSPVAANDSGTTTEDSSVTVNALTNDSDIDGDALSITAVTQGTRGSVTFTSSSVTYTPAANANGSDSFTYTISDGHGGSATATVAITIGAVNDAPDAVNDAAGTNEDAAVTVSVLANDVDVDGEAVILTGVTQGTRGSVVQNGNGTVTYTPNPNTFGADSFTYTVRDAAGLTDSATVTVNVAPVNDPPDAINDNATANEGGSVVITVLANDTDLEGNALTVIAVSTPAHGTATINGNGTVTYTPAPNYSGPDSFTYAISDGAATDTATVTVQVKDAIGNVAVLGTHSVWIQSGAGVLSGDVVANEAGSAPFLSSTEVTIGGSATTAAGWDVQGNRVTVASGATVASDVHYNQLSGGGSISGAQYTPLSLPVFAILPAFQSASPGSTDVNVANNGSYTLAPGSYRDLIVGRKATVTFTGGTYHFRSIQVDREARLFFSGGSGIRVQQKLSTGVLVTIGPGSGSSATAASIVFYVGGINGTSGTLAATPKAVEVGSDNVVSANIYAPNGTLWLKDHVQATGSFLGRDVNIGVNGQVSLMSAW